MIDVNKISEGVDYELIPAAQTNEQAWWIRMLTGPFPETVISFGNLSVDGKDESIHFNFSVVESPDPELSPDNEALQQYCGMVLHDVIEMSMSRDEVQITEKK
jgi:hypothetical protein